MAHDQDRSAWPAWATEPVDIADPDPSWSARGEALRTELQAQLAPWLRAGVHHVGSTSVLDLAAKPILDLMAGVDTLDRAADIARILRPHGWHAVPPALDRRAWRRFFVQVRDDRRVAHLHVMVPDEPRWNEQLVFRDRLRASLALRDEYAALKRLLARGLAHDREAYSAAKAEFVYGVVGERPGAAASGHDGGGEPE
jgi:GrpB-like predicted nucleotidyltransferase (UPF0157 family)